MTPELLEVSKRRHHFGTKRFKEKSLFKFHARIALKSLILLFVRLIARGARIGKTHTHTNTDRQTDRQTKYCNPLAHARRGLMNNMYLSLLYHYCILISVVIPSLLFTLYLEDSSVINPRRACARGLQYLSCLSVCVCVCVCVFPILAPRAIRRTNSSISDFSAIRA